MRLVSFVDGDHTRLGVREGDEVIDLSLVDSSMPRGMNAVLAAGDSVFDDIARAVSNAGTHTRRSLEDLVYAPPVSAPSKIICLGLNYADHAKEGGHDKPDYPSLFMRGPSSLVAHNQPIIRPLLSDTLDYEAELVAVVGKRCTRVSAKDAHDVIAGYSCFNDGSVREYQRKTSQWTMGKNFDCTGGFGPEFVTADELPHGATGLSIQSRLDGEVMQDDNTSNMLFNVADTVELLTAAMTLEPGDLIVMGTPAGVGYPRTPPVFMRHGAVCEIEIEGVGTLRNPVEDAVS